MIQNSKNPEIIKRNCPICHQSRKNELYYPSRSPGPVVRCNNCNFIYISELVDSESLIFEDLTFGLDPSLLVSSDLNDFPRDYWELSILPSKIIELPALEHNACDALARLTKYTSIGRILDFGCGWGFFLSVANRLGWQGYGLEPLPGHSTFARQKYKLDVTTGTLRENTYPIEFFDAITAFQVFEHLPNPFAIIRLLWKFQKPKGIIIIEVPNIKTLGVYLFRGHHRHFNPDHINFFSPQTIKLFLESNGYEVLETYYPVRYMTLYHLVNYWFRRLLPGYIVDRLAKLIKQRNLFDTQIKLNLHDIIGVIAQKKMKTRLVDYL